MSKQHWQSFGELNNSDAYKQSVNDEFQEQLPFEADDKLDELVWLNSTALLPACDS